MRQRIEFTLEEAQAWKDRLLQEPRVDFDRDTKALVIMFGLGELSAQAKSDMHENAMRDRDIPGYQIAYNRFCALGFTPDVNVCMMIASICDRPGTVVQYVSILCLHVYGNNPERMNVSWNDYFACFDSTMLTEATMRASWVAQKREHVNGLDFLTFP